MNPLKHEILCGLVLAIEESIAAAGLTDSEESWLRRNNVRRLRGLRLRAQFAREDVSEGSLPQILCRQLNSCEMTKAHRCVKQLEARGLLIRVSTYGARRSNAFRLTVFGRTAAETLLAEAQASETSDAEKD